MLYPNDYPFVFATPGIIAARVEQFNLSDPPSVVGSLGAPIFSSHDSNFVGILARSESGKLDQLDWIAVEKDIKSSGFKPIEIKTLVLPLVDMLVNVSSYAASAFIIGKEFGSGFLCEWKSKFFFLTNWHVLNSPADAKFAVLEFRGLSNVIRAFLDPEKLFFTNKWLDFTFVALSGASYEKLRYIKPLQLSTEKIVNDIEIQIIGYPKGQSVLRKSKGTTVVKPDGPAAAALQQFFEDYEIPSEYHGKFIAYKAQTAGGSSGSSIMDSNGLEVIAIHHTSLDIEASGIRVGTQMWAVVDVISTLDIPEGYGSLVSHPSINI